jgi:hypothetical protein
MSSDTVRRTPMGDSLADVWRLGASSTSQTAKQTTPMRSARVHGIPGNCGGFPGAPTTGLSEVASSDPGPSVSGGLVDGIAEGVVTEFGQNR